MNYYECQNFGICHKILLYIDTKEYLADKLFLEKEIRIRWIREFAHKNSPYLVIFCKVRKKDLDQFKEVMSNLERKMLICGHRDYVKCSEEIIKEITGGGVYA